MDIQNIKVLNYAPCFIAVSTRDRGVGLEPCRDGVPTFAYFTQKEIEYINSQSPVFRNGALEFEEADRQEVYKLLSIPDWNDRCIFERDIDDMILYPNANRMQRIIAIQDIQTIERIRGHVYKLVNEGNDVSIKVRNIVNKRFEEINAGIRISRIVVSPKTAAQGSVSANTEDIEAMKKEMEEMRAAMNSLASVQTASEPSPVVEKMEQPIPPSSEVADAKVEAKVEAKVGTPLKTGTTNRGRTVNKTASAKSAKKVAASKE